MDTPKGLIHRLTHPQSPEESNANAPDSDGEAADELGCWGWLRGVRDRAQMIELRRKDGHIMAVGYGWLDRAEYEPSEGITLYVTGREIKITGRNLDAEVRPNLRLFTAICRHRCLWLREADQKEAMSAGPKSTVIESIEW
jgi:hypothetical protein